MALNYNLSKLYARSDNNDPEIIKGILYLFVLEIQEDLKQMREGIKKKDYEHTYTYAHKTKPMLDLLGLNIAFEEILQVEAWTKAEGKKKAIKETFKSIKKQLKETIKEIKKDFDL